MAVFSWYTESLKIPRKLQAYLGDTAGSVPMHCNKASHNFAGEGRVLPSICKNKKIQHLWSTIKQKHNKTCPLLTVFI